LAMQQPARVGPRHLDEPEDHLGGDGAPTLVVDPGAKGEAERLGEHRAAVNAIEVLTDLADPLGQRAFDGGPVGGQSVRLHVASRQVKESAGWGRSFDHVRNGDESGPLRAFATYFKRACGTGPEEGADLFRLAGGTWKKKSR